jgi:arsenate reductase (glutaredoxin)
MAIKIYHNSRCRKSRAGLEYLGAKTKDFEVIEYLKTSITEEELRDILMKLNKKPSEIVRTQEEVYKKELKGKNFTDDEWIKILLENPKLIQRPIVVGKYKAVIAQPPEELDCLIE